MYFARHICTFTLLLNVWTGASVLRLTLILPEQVHNLLYWWNSHSDPSQRMLVWASEETGHRHLYLLLYQLSPATTSDDLPPPDDQGKCPGLAVESVYKCYYYYLFY